MKSEDQMSENAENRGSGVAKQIETMGLKLANLRAEREAMRLKLQAYEVGLAESERVAELQAEVERLTAERDAAYERGVNDAKDAFIASLRAGELETGGADEDRS